MVAIIRGLLVWIGLLKKEDITDPSTHDESDNFDLNLMFTEQNQIGEISSLESIKQASPKELVLLETFLFENVAEAYLLSLPKLIISTLAMYGDEVHLEQARQILLNKSEVLDSVLRHNDPTLNLELLSFIQFNKAALHLLMRSNQDSVAKKAIEVTKDFDINMVQELKSDYLKMMCEHVAVNPEILDCIKVTLRG